MAVLFAACSAPDNGDISVISGKWGRKSTGKICLYTLNNGELSEIASSTLSKDSAFYFALKSPKGRFYFIGTADKALTNKYPFYFKQGDRELNLAVTADSYILTGRNSPENTELTKWHDFIQPLEWISLYHNESFIYTDSTRRFSTYVDFFPLLEEKIKAAKDYPKSATANKEFNRVFEEYKKFSILNIAAYFTTTPRQAHPELSDFPDYYRNIDIAEYTKTAELLDYSPLGIHPVEKMIFQKLMLNKKEFANPMDAILGELQSIGSDTLKGELVIKFASTKRTFPGLLDYEEKYGKYLITDNQKEKLRVLKNTLNVMKDGAPAVDFKFPDANGKQIALSDFKGKLVYIDVWATWCGPCKQEIPHLKKLEEEYHNNKNIVFLSVSVDKSKDHAKWKEFLVKEGLKGVQIFAGDDSHKYMLEPYKISGIPRFILIGKDGNIISTDAPRPSSSEIKILFKDLKI
jgi:thiol-disulfide isomerase/thioredoxin